MMRSRIRRRSRRVETEMFCIQEVDGQPPKVSMIIVSTRLVRRTRPEVHDAGAGTIYFLLAFQQGNLGGYDVLGGYDAGGAYIWKGYV